MTETLDALSRIFLGLILRTSIRVAFNYTKLQPRETHDVHLFLSQELDHLEKCLDVSETLGSSTLPNSLWSVVYKEKEGSRLRRFQLHLEARYLTNRLGVCIGIRTSGAHRSALFIFETSDNSRLWSFHLDEFQ